MPVPEQLGGWSDGLVESGFASDTAAALLSWPARVRRMLAVEAALADAQAALGLMAPETAAAVTAACDPQRLAEHDPGLQLLGQAAATAASPVIPLLRTVRRHAGTPAAEALHRGATSQDIIDTAMVLCVRDALGHIDQQLRTLADSCANLATEHRHTVMAGRTLGQQAVPVTFGLKAARWLGAIDRRIQHLAWTQQRVCVLQFGGAAGTLAAYGPQALALAAQVADRLDLEVPDLPWHAERDRITELAGTLAGIISVTGSIAGELVRLASTEIGELRPARGTETGSSAMPHKINPVDATATVAAGRLAMGEITVLIHTAAEQHHERSAGPWQAEWVAVPSAIVRTGGAVERTVEAISAMSVDPDRMRENLDRGLGLTGTEALLEALTDAADAATARQLVADLATAARAEHRSLAETAAGDDRVTGLLTAARISEVLDPIAAVTHVNTLIDRALQHHRDLIDESNQP